MIEKARRSRYCSPALVLLAAAWLLAGCSDESDPSMAPGQAEYVKYCATCHGRDGTGKPPTFPPLAASEWLADGPEPVALIVLLGLKGEIEVAGQTYRGYMPGMRQIADPELTALLGYVGREWGGWSSTPSTERIAELRALTEGVDMLIGREGVDAARGELLE